MLCVCMKYGSAEYLLVSSGEAAWINADDTSTALLSEHCVGRDSPKLLTPEDTAAAAAAAATGAVTNTDQHITHYSLSLWLADFAF